MKVLLLNGSSRTNGCTFTALSEVAKVLESENIQCEMIHLGTEPIRDCIGCNVCRRTKVTKCVFDDDIVNEFIEKAKDFDGFVFGTPVYYAHPTGRILSVLDRVFFAGSYIFHHKPAMSVISARRGGTTASFDVLNKYFTISQMPVVSSTYWNMVHGNNPEEVLQDLEGLETMRIGAKNMAWLLKCIELGKNNGIEIPENKKQFRTNFIR